jgi:hypothetical protein
VADELTACLDEVSCTPYNKTQKWDSVRTAIKTRWNKNKIESISRRLDIYERAISVRLLALLNARSGVLLDHQEMDAGRRVKAKNDIVEAISFSQDQLWHRIDKSDEKAKQQHEDMIAAILKLQDGQIAMLKPLTTQEISSLPKSHRRIESAMVFRTTTKTDSKEKQTVDSRLGAAPEAVSFGPVAKRILDCLYFRQITDRVEEVPRAHPNTFDWIFRDPSGTQRPWHDFVEWLKTGCGCYWICGKAGSGKSTLMKYLYQHKKTEAALSVWAGRLPLLMPSFFFWHLGSPLQKSIDGLLRSVLLEILEKHQSLIPSVFPGLCRTLLAHEISNLSEPTSVELRKALANLLRLDSNLRICIFIDGVDEYDGNHVEIAEFFRSIPSPSIKVVLSSRPIPSCTQAFSDCPKLLLQDLTYDDIKSYVEDKLGANADMKYLEQLEGVAASHLINEITSKASGVFLWVTLVVKSLLEGLSRSDRIVDLQRRLDELPADLEKLYQKMLDSMDRRERQQASKILQLVLRSTEVQTQGPLSLLQLSFAEEDDLDLAICAPIEAMPNRDRVLRCERMEGRVRSRCCGLVEVRGGNSGQKNLNDASFTSYDFLHIGFIHKTVAEFLRMSNVWGQILDLTANTSFNADLALLASCVYEIKAFPYSNFPSPASKRAMVNMQHCFFYAKLLGELQDRSERALLMELHKAITQRWSRKQSSENLREELSMAASQCRTLPVTKLQTGDLALGLGYSLPKEILRLEDWHPEPELKTRLHRSCTQSWRCRCSPFVALAGFSGLILCTLDALPEECTELDGDRNDMMSRLLCCCLNIPSAPATQYVMLIEKLLQFDGFGYAFTHLSPETRENWTPWELFLAYAMRQGPYRAPMKEGSKLLFLEIMEQLVLAGADVEATRRYRMASINNKGSVRYVKRSAVAVVEAFTCEDKISMSDSSLAKFQETRDRLLALMRGKCGRCVETVLVGMGSPKPANPELKTLARNSKEQSSEIYEANPVSECLHDLNSQEKSVASSSQSARPLSLYNYHKGQPQEVSLDIQTKVGTNHSVKQSKSPQTSGSNRKTSKKMLSTRKNPPPAEAITSEKDPKSKHRRKRLGQKRPPEVSACIIS